MTSDAARINGLVAFRARQAEAKRLKMLELAEYRKDATVEIRDGREFVVVHIPDRYKFRRRAA